MKNTSLVSKSLDPLLLGGLLLLACFVSWTMLSLSPPDPGTSRFIYNCSFLVNFPHFLLSYQLLYSDFRNKIFKEWRYFWAGVIVPIVLVAAIAFAISQNNSDPLMPGYLLGAMYFFVGWHYVKQVFGAVMVSNARKTIFFGKWQRRSLKINLLLLWAVSFLKANTSSQTFSVFGFSYSSLDLPPIILDAAYAALALTAGLFFILCLRDYFHTGKMPSGNAVISVLTIYAWLLPALVHPIFAAMIPFYHSLQYLPFVYAFRKNKVVDQIKNPDSPKGRAKYFLGIWGYFTWSVIFGAISFDLLPGFLDQQMILDWTYGPTPFLFIAQIFLNIHHYFIDHVIWRGSNGEIRKYLFAAPTEPRKGDLDDDQRNISPRRLRISSR